MISDIATELVVYIFQYLDFTTLINLCVVSKKFRDIVMNTNWKIPIIIKNHQLACNVIENFRFEKIILSNCNIEPILLMSLKTLRVITLSHFTSRKIITNTNHHVLHHLYNIGCHTVIFSSVNISSVDSIAVPSREIQYLTIKYCPRVTTNNKTTSENLTIFSTTTGYHIIAISDFFDESNTFDICQTDTIFKNIFGNSINKFDLLDKNPTTFVMVSAAINAKNFRAMIKNYIDNS